MIQIESFLLLIINKYLISFCFFFILLILLTRRLLFKTYKLLFIIIFQEHPNIGYFLMVNTNNVDYINKISKESFLLISHYVFFVFDFDKYMILLVTTTILLNNCFFLSLSV